MEFKIEPLKLTKKILKQLSLYMSKFFDLEDLVTLCEQVVSVDFIKTRSIDEDQMVLYKITRGTKTMTITDNLDLDHFPFRRWIEIEFDNTLSYSHQIFYYEYTSHLYYYITNALAFAYNIKMYGGPDAVNDYDIYKRLVLGNYSKLLYIFINKLNNPEQAYDDIMGFAHTFIYDIQVRLGSNIRFFKVIPFEEIIIEAISLTDECLKFQISNKTDRICIYINRNIIGVSNLNMAIEQSYHIYIKNKG